MNEEEFAENLATINHLKSVFKEISMIYQYSLKVEVAEYHGVALNKYLYLPYDKWAKIRDKFLKEHNRTWTG